MLYICETLKRSSDEPNMFPPKRICSHFTSDCIKGACKNSISTFVARYRQSAANAQQRPANLGGGSRPEKTSAVGSCKPPTSVGDHHMFRSP